MIVFPETAQQEWNDAEAEANVNLELQKKIERGVSVEKELERLRVRHEAQQLHQAELDAEATPVLEMFTLATHKADPAAVPADLIEGVLKDKGVTLVLGPSGSGKSTSALQLLHSLATGDDWLGQTATQLDGGFGIASYDMDASLMMDWMSGFPGIDPHSVSVVNAYRQGNPLGVPAMRAQIAEAWQAMKVEVVMIDSFSASFFGHDQNDAALTQAHYRDLKKFALTEVGARHLIVIVHSTDDKPGKARGSSVHKDVADSVMVIEGTGTDKRRIYMEKYRAGRGQHMMEPVIVTAPDAVTHLVDLDLGAMSLAGLHLPPSAVGAAAFPDLPDPHDDPQTSGTDSDSDEENDDEDR